MKKAFQSYGRYYEIIYADKDYEKECDFLEEAFRKYSKPLPKRILDVGCGTGGHAILLARRGYKVTGIDASETMIRQAKTKADTKGVEVDFRRMDVSRLRLGGKFDACVCMFAVIDYLTDDNVIGKSLSNIRDHLEEGSLFVFDFWYGPAVLAILPSARLKRMEREGVGVIRFAEPRLDAVHHVCRVNYYLIARRGRTILDEVEEEHVVRFFFPEEIKRWLEGSGFELVKLCSFPDLNVKPSERTWNVAAVSKAV